MAEKEIWVLDVKEKKMSQYFQEKFLVFAGEITQSKLVFPRLISDLMVLKLQMGIQVDIALISEFEGHDKRGLSEFESRMKYLIILR